VSTAKPTLEEERDAIGPARPRHAGRYRRALRRPRGAVGLILVLLPVLLSLLGPLVLRYSPVEQGPAALQPPSVDHLLGTDEVGRDLLARVLAGTRVELLITLVAVPIAAVLGTLLGSLAAVNRFADAIFQRVFDVLLGVPAVIVGVSVAVVMTPGMESLMIAIVLVTMPMFGRQARGALLIELSQDYVTAADVLGFPRRRVMLHHILPNTIDAIFVRFAVTMALAIMVEGSVSVIGLGIQPPQTSLGSLIKNGSIYMFDFPLYALAPIFVVVMLIVGYTMIADALNQAVLRK
jgi:peptide/nickel transport system permease protein